MCGAEERGECGLVSWLVRVGVWREREGVCVCGVALDIGET